MSGLKFRLVPCPEEGYKSSSQEQNEIGAQSKKVSTIIFLQWIWGVIIIFGITSPPI